jgi:uncharacterized membrane protein (DUF2068 family)
LKLLGDGIKHRRPSRIGFLGFEVIGAYKLISGILALALGIWSVCFLDHDPLHGLERVIFRLGLDPENHVIHSGISALSGVNRKHLRALEAGTFAYAVLHLIEGIGLIRGRDWAGYLVVIATSSLIPFEIYEITRKPNLVRISLLIVNVGIVIFLIATMRKEHIQAEASPKPPKARGNDILL